MNHIHFTHWRKQRQPLKLFQLWRLIGWIMVGIVVYMSLTSNPVELPDLDYGDKIGHFSAYFMLMIWFAQLYRRTRHGWILAAVLGLGIALELIQGQTAFRMFEYADIAANAMGAISAWGLAKTPLARLIARTEDVWLQSTRE